MVNVAILGGTRFIGPHLIKALEMLDYDISILNRGISISPIPLPSRVKFFKGDRNDPNCLSQLFKYHYDFVFDLSGYTTNQIAPILERYRSKIGHYIFCSTPSVFITPPPVPVTEKSPRVFEKETYGGEKALIEELLCDQYQKHQWPITIVRPLSLFGPFDPWMIGSTIHRLKNSLPIITYKESSNKSNPLYINDLINCFIKIMNNRNSYGKIYNLGGKDIISPLQLINDCASITRTIPILKKGNSESPKLSPQFETGLWTTFPMVLDNSKIEKDLKMSWTPIDQSLRETINWLNLNSKYLKNYSFSGERYILNNQKIPKIIVSYYQAYEKFKILKKSIKESLQNFIKK